MAVEAISHAGHYRTSVAAAQSSVPNSIIGLIKQIFTGDLFAVVVVTVFNCVAGSFRIDTVAGDNYPGSREWRRSSQPMLTDSDKKFESTASLHSFPISEALTLDAPVTKQLTDHF